MLINRATISRWALVYALPGVVIVACLVLQLVRNTEAAHGITKIKHKYSAPGYKIIHSSGVTSGPVSKSPSIGTDSPNKISGLPPIHEGLADSGDPQLIKLGEFEKDAGGALAGGLMIFTETPSTTVEAQTDARQMATRLSAFAKYGLRPIVVIEPTSSGVALNFTGYRNGAYDSALNTYFNILKSLGVQDNTMGMWVYFPEANLPEWGPVDLADYAANITKSIQIQKKYFPASESSIMLDAESYPAGTNDWSLGAYVSLAPFLNGIPPGLVDSFGLQGFPWAPPANQGGSPSYDPSIYLNSNLAADAANRLGTKSIWLNTGTFSAMYTRNKSQTVNMDPAHRQALLNSVVSQAVKLKQSGYLVAVNLFSEDKSATSEATDWSYKTAQDKAVLNSFASQLNVSGIGLWIFSG